ncbi:hypothetical protein ACL02O_27510 [Micromonospora sp. MS34]|uniref:hypothetical protein n=1 Tax=Micromonospora sp. MS34 TaxID=3385971 RepID=UPI0039A2F5F9
MGRSRSARDPIAAGRVVERAYAVGLACRPVTEMVDDTWRWLREVGRGPARAGRPVQRRIR